MNACNIKYYFKGSLQGVFEKYKEFDTVFIFSRSASCVSDHPFHKSRTVKFTCNYTTYIQNIVTIEIRKFI